MILFADALQLSRRRVNKLFSKNLTEMSVLEFITPDNTFIIAVTQAAFMAVHSRKKSL
jgi:hypothetical protein